MRTLLLLIACLIHILAAGEVSIGNTALNIPTDDEHRELNQESPFLRSIRAFIPADIRLLYAEAPTKEAQKANEGEATRISLCHLLMTLNELADEVYTREDFIDTKEELASGLKEGLEDATMEETLELMRITFSQRAQKEFTIESPTLVGEPEITDDQVQFTMLMAVMVGEQKVAQAIRGTIRPIRNKLVFAYSYQQIDGEDAIARVTKSHAAFIERLVRSNSLVLPDADTDVEETQTSTPPPSKPTEESTDKKPTSEESSATTPAIIP